MNRIRVAYNQKNGLNPNKIDYNHPRIIDETEKLQPLEVNDGELAKKYLKTLTEEITYTKKNYNQLKKELEIFTKQFNNVIDTINKRISTYTDTYYDVSDEDLRMMRLGYEVMQKQEINNLNHQVQKIMELIK